MASLEAGRLLHIGRHFEKRHLHVVHGEMSMSEAV
jgi:hypothetical protein